MQIAVILAVALVSFLVFVGAALFIMSRNDARKKERKLSVIRGQSTETKTNARDSADKRRADIARKLKESGDGSDGVSGKPKLAQKLEQAGMTVTPKQFWLYSVLFAVFVTILCKVMGLSPFVILMVGITALLGIPRAFLSRKIKKRQKKFLEEFSDALEAMVRLLKAGMPVSEAIAMASKEYVGPVGEEMARIYDSQKIGVPLQEAALEAARRMPLTEMQMFATGLAIQAQTGASLSEVLTNLAGVIRARFRLKRKVQALSAEAKASAMIIGAMPVVIGGGLYLINKDYIGLLFTDPTGRLWLVGGIFWMMLGVFVMKAMINFKV